MRLESNVSLATLTTLKVGGPALYVAYCSTVADIREAIHFAISEHLPWYVLGEGSNVLVNDNGFHGVVIRNELQGLSVEEREERVTVTGGAGISWEQIVTFVTNKGLWGIENLAGIPGTLGAAPVQNIGAYGSELRDSLVSVCVYDSASETEKKFSVDECELGYRDSRFKRERNLIITSVTLSLLQKGMANMAYPDVRRRQEEGADLSTPQAIGETIRSIRSKKFPDLKKYGTAGSFFKNPVVREETYTKLRDVYPSLPGFPYGTGVKIPLAYILDHVLNLKGHAHGKASLFIEQPLVLVVEAGGSAREVEALAVYVEEKVFEKTNIRIEREVQSLL